MAQLDETKINEVQCHKKLKLNTLFPNDLKDTYKPISQNLNQFFDSSDNEGLLIANQDRREKPPLYLQSRYFNIGLLRIEGNNQLVCATGTIFYKKDDHFYIITCAHNVITFNNPLNKNDGTYYDPIWFEGRSNCALYGSYIHDRLEIEDVYVYPEYFKSQDFRDGNDLAILKTKKYKECNINYRSMYIETPGPYYVDVNIGLYGFPGEKKGGDLWGMSGKVDLSYPEIIAYDTIDTTPGQSGSPLMFANGIFGVHTTHTNAKNFATKITKKKMEWISHVIKENIVEHAKSKEKKVIIKKPIYNKFSFLYWTESFYDETVNEYENVLVNFWDK